MESTGCLGEDGSLEPGTRSSAGEHALHTGGVVGSIPTVSTTPHFVYLIGNDDRVKIGHGKNPKSRLSGIRVGSPYRIDLLHTWQMARADAVKFEATLHGDFAWCRMSGEWFDIHWFAPQHVGKLRMSGDGATACQALAALAEWYVRKNVGDAHWSYAAEPLVAAYRTGLPLMNEWDEVFL